MWRLKIKQYFQVQDYALWDVIENGNSFKPAAKTTTNVDGTSTTLIPCPVTTEEKVQKKNDMNATLPNEHLKTLISTKMLSLCLLLYKQDLVRNKPDLDTMSFDDLYNNFNIVEQEVKGTASSNSSSSSQNVAFVSSFNSTNKVNTAYRVSTANTQLSPASTQVSTTSTQVSTANLYDLEEMDLKWQLALLSMRTRRFFQKTRRKITINGSDTAGYDKSKVECFNCHKLGHFARECRGTRNQDSRNRIQDNSRRTVNVEETSSKAMLAIDGARFDWSYMADDEVPTNMALMAFSDSDVHNDKTWLFSPTKVDLSNSGLEEFQQPKFEGYGPKTSKSVSEDISNEVRESPDALLVKELVSDDKLEKKTIFPTVAKIEFVRPKQQEKPVRKPVKYAKMYRSQSPRGNQRNWNNQKSQQLGSSLQLPSKEKGGTRNNYTRANYNYSAKKAHPNAHRNMLPRAVLMKTSLRSLNMLGLPKAVNTARPNSAVVNAVRANQVNAVKASAC
ncbi:ribonuclease H-like domain-containing protein [Tanacetum coccineum]